MAAPREVSIEANGLRFESLVAGPADGEAVILLHGYPQSAASWVETMAWLAGRGYRSIAPNLRGYSPGANPRDAADYAMSNLVADVVGIADAQQVRRFHLVGHDWGGALAWAVASAHPQRLLSLTSIATPHAGAMLEALRSSTQSLRSSYFAFFRIPRVPEAMLQAANYAQLGLSLRATGLPGASWRRDRAQLRRVGMRGPLNWYRGATRGMRPRRVSVPTLYIWGRRDPFLGRKAAQLTERWVTGPYRFEELKAGHWIIDRNAADLQRILGEHLEDFGAPAAKAQRAPQRSVTRKATAKRSAPRKAAAKRVPAKPAPRKRIPKSGDS